VDRVPREIAGGKSRLGCVDDGAGKLDGGAVRFARAERESRGLEKVLDGCAGIVMEIRLLHAQLRRMRAMNFRYHALFFRQINFWIAMVALLLAASLLESLRAVVFIVPYLILYAAMQGAFHFHYIIFARRYARTLERKINQLNGNDVLVAHQLEETYLFPLDAPRFVGVSLGNPLSFFSAITLHYGIAGTVLWGLSLYRAAQLAPTFAPNFAPLNFYSAVTIVWTLANLSYLAWYFIGQRDEQRVEQILSKFVPERA
jgi:hypothetical protein